MCSIIIAVMSFLRDLRKIINKFLLFFLWIFVATFIYFFGTEVMGSGKELMERLLFTSDKSVEWYLPF